MVKTLKSQKSSGYDGISTKLLKQIILNIVSPLGYIFNLSLSTGCCPDLLKIAKVIPIYRKDDPSLKLLTIVQFHYYHAFRRYWRKLFIKD